MAPHSTPHVRTRSRPSQSTPALDGVILSRKTETALTPPSVRQSKFECVAVERLTTGDTKVRRHPKTQLNRLIASLNRFQHAAPILVDGRYRIIDGHLLFEALKRLGQTTIAVQVIDHLSDPEIETLRISLHAIQEMSIWDDAALKISLEGLFKIDPLLIEFTALPMAKVDALMLSGFETPNDAVDETPATPKTTWLRLGDSFIPKTTENRTPVHRLVCGDAKDPMVVARALDGQQARMLFSDIPFGLVPINGTVSRRHGEFTEGSNMSEPEAKVLFDGFFTAWTQHLMPGGSAFLFIDYRAMFVLTQATRDADLTHICTIAWDKMAGGMGGLYRHQVEFVLVLAKGERIAVNNVRLGKYGRNRTTLWSSPGMAQFGPDREAALEAHPTVKPVAVLSEAILDVTNPGEIVLDPCMGSGSTLVAADRVNRVGVGIEIDPVFFEVAVRRLQAVVGSPMIHEETGLTLDALLDERAAQAAAQA
jgi:hypothetical protein